VLEVLKEDFDVTVTVGSVKDDVVLMVIGFAFIRLKMINRINDG